jgi:hypothetical protein
LLRRVALVALGQQDAADKKRLAWRQVRGSGNHGIFVDRGAGAGGACVVSGVKVEASQNRESGVVVLGCRAALRDSVCSFNGADGGAHSAAASWGPRCIEHVQDGWRLAGGGWPEEACCALADQLLRIGLRLVCFARGAGIRVAQRQPSFSRKPMGYSGLGGYAICRGRCRLRHWAARNSWCGADAEMS